MTRQFTVAVWIGSIAKRGREREKFDNGLSMHYVRQAFGYKGWRIEPLRQSRNTGARKTQA